MEEVDRIGDGVLDHHAAGIAVDQGGDRTVQLVGQLAASSTAPNWSLRFKQFVIVKNEQIIYKSHPNQEEYAFEFRDRGFTAGSNYYYIHVVQNDGQVAWSSPIWVE